jgi:Ca2+-binding RTX toxin-like protein
MEGTIAERGSRTVRRGLVIMATIFALPAFAGAASAATVSRSGTTITYQAAAGETNSTVVTRSGSDFTFTETGPTGQLTNGANCIQVSNNVVRCTQSNPTIVANLLDQNDTFSASGVTTPVSVTFNGGSGDDTLSAPDVNTTLNGDDGNDTLNGANGDDTLNGGNNDDQLFGNGGADSLNGGADAGMDRMTGGDKDDVLDGGPGIDRAIYSTGNTTITIDNVANDGDGQGDTDNVKDTVESITGSSGNDSITGSCFSNTLAGQAGNDTLNGDPTTCGSYGGDFMGGGSGNDTMVGSQTPTATDGVDRVTYTSNTAAQPVTVSLDGNGNDSDGLGGTSDNVGRDIEYLYGGPEVDTFSACGTVGVAPCSGANGAFQGVSFWTGANNDSLVGSAFNDYFDGQGGADTQDCKGGANDMYKVDAADPAPTNCETAVP